MSMDALTVAAFDSLHKDVVPRLAKALAALAKVPADKRAADPQLLALVTEARELLVLVEGWMGGATAPEGGASDLEAEIAAVDGGETGGGDDDFDAMADDGEPEKEMTDEEAQRLLEIALSEEDDAVAAPKGMARVPAKAAAPAAKVPSPAKPSAAQPKPPSDELSDDAALAMLAAMGGDDDAAEAEMSDDEARKMLAAMDAPLEAPASDEADPETAAMLAAMEAGDAPAADAEPSDDEAAEMLAAMDAAGDTAGDGEMSDDEARQMLAMMDAPLESAGGADGEMSDDEARKLLAAMDEPASDGEMSDDEARKLLAAMDEPAPASAAKPAAKTAAKPAAKAAPAPAPAPVASADDEAMAMLLAMGGADDADAVPAPEPEPAAPAADHHADGDDHGEGEVEEFAKNDFRSDPEMMKDFNTNTEELLETLDATILQLEQNPTDRETIESIFRAAHTLKGAAGMFGFKAIERVMHHMEHLFDQVRKGKLVPDAACIDVVLQGMDVLRGLMKAAHTGTPSGIKTAPVVKALSLAASGKASAAARKGGAKTAAAPSAATGGARAGGDDAHGGHDAGGGGGASGAGGAGGAKKNEQASTIRVDLERLDALVNLVGELVIDRTRFASIEEDIRTSNPQLPVAGNMSETVQLFGRHMTEIHEIIMKIRMVPIGNAFNKFSRIVRDLSRQLEKEIELIVDGEDTELDKTLVEQIGDPLIHLIRNCCDHGVELPAVREAAGKPRSGKIFLSARQEGNNIIITIEDDGKGIPADIIRKKAIEKGLISEDAQLSKRDIFNLIFEPGFSTAEKVTTISGRGVGMDVVRKQISKLKGLIDVDSEIGQGTTITIRLPLTLAIVQSLLVESQGESFAIPLATVVESVRIKPEEIQRVGDAEVIKRHGYVLPLMHLSDTLALSTKKESSWYSGYRRGDEPAPTPRASRRRERLFVVIVGSGDRRFGIIVDALLTQQEMVIKSLGPIMKNVPCVAGGAVLGNGEVVLVLDIQELEDQFRSRNRGANLAA